MSALDELHVDYADASAVDSDPDAPAPVKIAILSALGSGAARDADIAVLGGPGDFRDISSALRLEASDIESRTRRWIAVAEKLGQKLGRPALAKFTAGSGGIDDRRALSLAFPQDPLSKDFAPSHSPEALTERLAAITARAEAAERANASLELERFNAQQQAKQSDTPLARDRARIASLEQMLERLTALSESTAYALACVPADLRAAVASAREHAWRARLAAARAAEAAKKHPDALAWPRAKAFYSGETRNRPPHGHGVIVFRDGAVEVARYAGAFADGQRSGHGVVNSDGGHTWIGQWSDGEAHGHGLLESAEGSRFEGEVATDETGSPRQVRGWTWGTAGAAKTAQQPHRAVAPALPSPHAASSRP